MEHAKSRPARLRLNPASGLERQSASRVLPPQNYETQQRLQWIALTERRFPSPPFAWSQLEAHCAACAALSAGSAWGRGGKYGNGRGGARARSGFPPAQRSRQRRGRGGYITCAAPPLREDVACSLAPGESPRLPRELGERNWRRSTPGGSALQHEPTSSRSRSRRPGRGAAAAAATSGRVSGAEFEPAPSGESGPSP